MVHRFMKIEFGMGSHASVLRVGGGISSHHLSINVRAHRFAAFIITDGKSQGHRVHNSIQDLSFAFSREPEAIRALCPSLFERQGLEF